MRVLITGSAGFIGRALTAELLQGAPLAAADGSEAALQRLLLLDRVALPPPTDPRVQVLQGDAADAALLQRLLGDGIDTVFVLGATLTTEAEADPDRSFEVTVLGLTRLVAACRAARCCPRVVFASSIAAFGGTLPEVVGDEQPQHPQTSYGTHKAIAELLLHDASRHRFVDARCLRLPVVVVRPGTAGTSVSDRIAALVREPLGSADVVCPLAPQTRLPLASVQTVARALVAVQKLPPQVFGASRALNLPSLTVRVDEWVAAAQTLPARRLWRAPIGRVSWQPDPRLQAIVDGWPRGFDSALARRLGLPLDTSAEAIVDHFADRGLDRLGLGDGGAPPAGPARPASDDGVCIVGAGSSGVAAAKALLQRGVAFDIFEKGSRLGGMWRYENDNGLSSAYRSLHIDTSRKSLQYPDFPIPEHLPDFLSHWQVADYLEAYARHFGVAERVRYGTEVQRVEPAAGGGWQVTLAGGETRRYRAVVVANGHLWCPRWPDFPGRFDGQVVHSHDYRTPTPYEGKRVLVVGIGNSAVDIAVDLCRSAKSVTLSTRRGAWVVPKYIMGVPTDRWGVALARTLRLPTPWVRRIMGKLIYLAVGNQERVGVPKPAHPIWREHACVSQDLLPYVGHGWIRIRPNVRELQGDHVLFDDGRAEPFDAIVHATGYRTVFPFLDREVFEVRDGDARLYRRIVAPEQPGLYFVGLVQPIGPTVPLVEVQSRWLAAVLAGEVKLPGREAMHAEIGAHRRRQQRYVDSPRYTLEVDFREHAAELRRDLATT